ncbi:MAG: M20 metallopeptidase family protein [Nocardioides sp.]
MRTDQAGDLQALRRILHRCPEIGLDLPRTQAVLIDALTPLDVEISVGRQLSSVIGVIRGTPSERRASRGGAEQGSVPPAVLLRADMDALPITEETDLPYRSEHAGAMHACGHDLHMAMLVGAARILLARRDRLHGDVVLMFQPGEEGYAGARLMIEEGVLSAAGPTVGAAFALHVWAGPEPCGTFATKEGTVMAASDQLSITVLGQGGHGANPHLARDPIPAAAAMVGAIQTAITRFFDAFDPVIVTVGQIHAGNQRNIIPDSAFLEATVRTFSAAQRDRAWELLPRVCEGVAAAHGVSCDVALNSAYPRTYNTAAETAFAHASIARSIGDPSRVRQWRRPLTGAEDFAFVLERVPGSFISLSAAPSNGESSAVEFNHSPRAMFDDNVLDDGAIVLAGLAQEWLAHAAASPP